MGLSASKYGDWQKRYGKVYEFNSLIPRDFWLERWEQQRIINYYIANPNEGYRRLTFMMLDEGVVAVSPSSVYRVLKKNGLLEAWAPKASRKGVTVHRDFSNS